MKGYCQETTASTTQSLRRSDGSLGAGESMLLELGVDFVDSRLSHIANSTQIGICLADQLTNGVDANALQDVVGPIGEVELLDHCAGADVSAKGRMTGIQHGEHVLLVCINASVVASLKGSLV